LQAQRRKEHARAAPLIAREAATQPALAALAAWHWRCAEEWEPALTWTLKAAEHATSLYAGQEAQHLYEQALELAERLAAPAAVARAAAGLAELAAHRGEFPQALEYYGRARQQIEAPAGQNGAAGEDGAENLALHAAVLRGQARVHSLTGSPARALPLLEEAVRRLGVQA